MMERNAKSIRVELEDGTVQWAEGDDAKVLWEWLISCETMCCIHGAKYYGPLFQIIPPGSSS